MGQPASVGLQVPPLATEPPAATATATYRVLATAGAFEPGFRGGGPIRSLAYILDTLPDDLDVTLVTRDRDLGATAAYPELSGRLVRRTDRSAVFYLDWRRPRHWTRLVRHVRARPVDLLYLNSLWSLFSLLPILLVALRMVSVSAIVVAPRGELAPGALAIKSRKKRIFLTFWAPILRLLDVRWHACSSLEEAHIRAAFPAARVMTNGAESPIPDQPCPPPAVHDGPLRLVFVSRIAVIKNLTTALAALAKVSRPVDFDIYGPPEDERYWSRCRQIITAMPAHVRVRYHGELLADAVLPTFSRYDAFVFPTLGENYGHVILESLAAGCPVICFDTTPFSELIGDAGGRVVRPMTADGLAEVLDALAAWPPAERVAAKRAAAQGYRRWRRRNYDLNVLDHARIFCR